MSQSMVQILLWGAAGVILIAFMARRRKRKALR
jgi:LPXTG-motif cell wall-anchored protein